MEADLLLLSNTDNISVETQHWITMMKYMLECAEHTTSMINILKNNVNFTDQEIEKLSKLGSSFHEVGHTLSLIGDRFFTPIDSNIPQGKDGIARTPAKKVNHHAQTNVCDVISGCQSQISDEQGNTNYKSSRNVDACVCSVLTKNFARAQRRGKKLVVCSNLNRPTLAADICPILQETVEPAKKFVKPARVNISPEFCPADDDHPYIIKHPGVLTFPKTGVGYELYYAMCRNEDEIAEYIEATNESQTYAELLRNCSAVAQNLQQHGLGPNNVVCLFMSYSLKYASTCYLACLFAGCPVCALDTSFPEADVLHFLKLISPSLIFVQREKYDTIKNLLIQAELPDVKIINVGGEGGEGESLDTYLKVPENTSFNPYKVDSLASTCIIVFNNGKYGEPFATKISHYSMLNQMVLASFHISFKSVYLFFTSFYWIAAIINIGAIILSGSSRVSPLQFGVNRFFSLVEKFKVTSSFLERYEFIKLSKATKPPEMDINSLKLLIFEGAPIKESVFSQMREKFPSCYVYRVYGQNEIGVLLQWNLKNPDDITLYKAKPVSCGRPLGGFWYKIVHEETQKIQGPNHPGELYVKSEYTTAQNYAEIDPSSNFDKKGWFKTGDLCYYDEYHCFYVIDKVKECVRYRGWFIDPTPLEKILLNHPAVVRAHVIGMPHIVDDEHAMGLVVVNSDTVTEDDIKEFVNSQLPERTQLKAGIKFVKSIPTARTSRNYMRNSILMLSQET